MKRKPTIKDVVKRYHELKAQKDALAAKHKEELAPVNEQINKMEVLGATLLAEGGADSIKTDAGTIYMSTITKYSVEDMAEYCDYLATMDAEDIMGCISKSISSEAANAYVDENNTLPPGVKVASFRKTNFRKPTK